MTTTVNRATMTALTKTAGPQFPDTWKAPDHCLCCQTGVYALIADGTDSEQGGELTIKNLLGISIQPNRWRLLRCTNENCRNVQLFRIPG